MEILFATNRHSALDTKVVLVHSSDLHVDDSRVEGLRAVLATAAERRSDIVLLAGDTFENNQLNASVLNCAGRLLSIAVCKS
jgi:DNA repair exonuclease SbcCD nuclease subunit